MEFENTKMRVVAESIKKKTYITLEELKAHESIDYAFVTRKNVASEHRHNIEAIEGNFESRVDDIDSSRLFREDTPKGKKPYTSKELKEILRSLGLKMTGKRDEQAERIRDYLDDLQ